jgi:hypothetical protein
MMQPRFSQLAVRTLHRIDRDRNDALGARVGRPVVREGHIQPARKRCAHARNAEGLAFDRRRLDGRIGQRVKANAALLVATELKEHFRNAAGAICDRRELRLERGLVNREVGPAGIFPDISPHDCGNSIARIAANLRQY